MRKIGSCALALLSIVLCAKADAQSSLAGQLAQCTTIFGAVPRLACYDRVAHSANPQAALPLPAVPAAPAIAAPLPQYSSPTPAGPIAAAPSSQTRPEQFGSESLAATPAGTGQPASLNQISSAVVDYHFTPQGRFVVSLSNGQVWQQMAGDVAVPNLGRKVARSAIISRGFLGSYNLSFSDQTGRFKVIRPR